MAARLDRTALSHIVVVKRQKPLEKEHDQKPAEQPGGAAIHRMQGVLGVREQTQDGESEHQAGHKTDRHLQPGVREPDKRREQPARQRGQGRHQAIGGEQPGGGARVHQRSFSNGHMATPPSIT